MKTGNFITAIFFVLIVFCGGCKSTAAVSPYTGFTKTDASGNIISADPNDWKNIPQITGALAYPNPTTSGSVMLKFNLTASAYVDIKVYRDDSTLELDYAPGVLAGSQTVLLDISKLQTGWIYKCYIFAGNSSTYGNISIP